MLEPRCHPRKQCTLEPRADNKREKCYPHQAGKAYLQEKQCTVCDIGVAAEGIDLSIPSGGRRQVCCLRKCSAPVKSAQSLGAIAPGEKERNFGRCCHSPFHRERAPLPPPPPPPSSPHTGRVCAQVSTRGMHNGRAKRKRWMRFSIEHLVQGFRITPASYDKAQASEEICKRAAHPGSKINRKKCRVGRACACVCLHVCMYGAGLRQSPPPNDRVLA